MPYINHHGVRIHYKAEGEGPPLVLQHGTPQDIEDWRDSGWVDGLKNDYRLVLIDARGHGLSGKPHDTALYTLEWRVKDILAVLDELGIAKAHYFGYSTGGWIAFGIGRYAPERFHSLVIGASHPYERSMQAQRESFSKGIEAYVATLGDLPLERRRRRLALDARALIAVQQDRPNTEDALPSMTMPCLVIVGEDDPLCAQAREGAKLLPNATFLSFTGLDHSGGFRRSDLVLPDIKKFLENVNQELGL